MSAEREELITEAEAALILGITQQRLRAIESQGMLQPVSVRTPVGIEIMHYRGEVLRLRERLRAGASTIETEEWPDVIGE